jgi:hypothetical protein
MSVVPGALTDSTKRPLAWARNVDLPTFGRPTRATTGAVAGDVALRRSAAGTAGGTAVEQWVAVTA